MPNLRILDNCGWDGRILAVGLDDLVQSFIVVTRRFNVLVDTMVNQETALELVDLARQAGPGRELLAVNTHADWDHFWGNQVFAGPILAQRLAAERALDQEAREDLRQHAAREPERYAGVRLTAPNVLFDERLTVDGGDLTLELFRTPGHTIDHIAVYLPEIGTLLAGDAAEEPFPLVGGRGCLRTLRASLQAMRDLRPRHALYCHAPVETGPALLDRNLAHFDEMERRCRSGGDFPLLEAAGGRTDLPGFYAESHTRALKLMRQIISCSH